MMTSLSKDPHKLRGNEREVVAVVNGLYWGLAAPQSGLLSDADKVFVKATKCAKWLVSTQCKPSLILHGGIGTGKSTMLRAMFRAVRMTDRRCALVTADMLSTMKMEKTGDFESMLDGWYEFLFIDDVGVEPADVKSYGNQMYPFAEIVRARYDAGLPIVITTNLKYPEEFAKIYGDRVADRLREMANSIEFKGNSYRK